MSRPETKFSRSGYVEVTHQNDPRVMRSFAKHLREFLERNTLRWKRIKCSCNECKTTFAFVYADDPEHTIHLGDLFFKAHEGPRGEDSRVGVLVHELTHFTDVLGTDDLEYESKNMQRAYADTDNHYDDWKDASVMSPYIPIKDTRHISEF